MCAFLYIHVSFVLFGSTVAGLTYGLDCLVDAGQRHELGRYLIPFLFHANPKKNHAWRRRKLKEQFTRMLFQRDNGTTNAGRTCNAVSTSSTRGRIAVSTSRGAYFHSAFGMELSQKVSQLTQQIEHFSCEVQNVVLETFSVCGNCSCALVLLTILHH